VLKNTVIWMGFTLTALLVMVVIGCDVSTNQKRQQPMDVKNTNWKLSTEVFSVDIPKGWYVHLKYEDTVYFRKPNSAERVMIAVAALTPSEDSSSLIRQSRKEAISLSEDGRWKSIRMKVGGHLYEGIEFVVHPREADQKHGKFIVRQVEITHKNRFILIGCLLPNGKETEDIKRILDSFQLIGGRDGQF
jgi:hypothetical protein